MPELTALPAGETRGDGEKPSVTLRAGTGDVRLRLAPGDGGLQLDASTGVGSLDVGVGLANRAEKRSPVGGTVTGTVGAAQCSVVVRAGTGSVSVREF